MCRYVFSIIAIAAALLSGCAPQKKMVFVSGDSIHLWGDHEHAIMCDELARMIGEATGGKIRAVHLDAQKASDFSELDGADAVVLVCEGEANHPFKGRTEILERARARGANIGAFHYSLMFSGDSDNAALDKVIGGHYQKGFSYNPFYEARFEVKNSHPVLNGVKSFGYEDEWHFNIAFSKDAAQKITPILQTKVPDKIRRRRSAPESVRAEFGKGRLETIAWLCENPDGTRGFGMMGGHYVWTLAQKDYRKTVLNMLAWLAEIDIPQNGFDARFCDFDSIAPRIKKPLRPDYEYYIKDRRDFDAKCRAER